MLAILYASGFTGQPGVASGLSYNLGVRHVAILMLCFVSLAAGCPRQSTEGALASSGTATYPWELPGYAPEAGMSAPAGQPDEGHSPTEADTLELPVARGPAFPAEDTLDLADLPGQWLQVCVCSNEQLDLTPVNDMDMLELRVEKTMTWNIHMEGQETQFLEGYWDKPGPGQISLQAAGNPPVILYCQLYNHDFLFMWSYEQKLGHWFVRFPSNGSTRITRNRFSTTFGNMVFTEVGDLGFRGSVSGDYDRSIGGRYVPGVITMRWEEPATNSAGYAAFLVDPNFETLNGVWWLDDYEAAPFGGPWTGNADDSIELPAAAVEPAI